ncbi:hypothetical protein AAMO2058_001612800 [Amorphochlora amoebiformis]|eukprot:1140554-Amorphochlora_amoeboformis.AAC.1
MGSCLVVPTKEREEGERIVKTPDAECIYSDEDFSLPKTRAESLTGMRRNNKRPKQRGGSLGGDSAYRWDSPDWPRTAKPIAIVRRHFSSPMFGCDEMYDYEPQRNQGHLKKVTMGNPGMDVTLPCSPKSSEGFGHFIEKFMESRSTSSRNLLNDFDVYGTEYPVRTMSPSPGRTQSTPATIVAHRHRN